MKIRLYIKDGEPILHIKRTKERNTWEYDIGLFYPFYRIANTIYDFNLRRRFKKMGYPTIRCEGCGDGISEWEIDEPNGEKCKIKVCDRCVGFYDWRFSKLRLEIKWDVNNDNVYRN